MDGILRVPQLVKLNKCKPLELAARYVGHTQDRTTGLNT